MKSKNPISILTQDHIEEISNLHSKLIPGLLQKLDYSIIKIFYETALKSEYNFGFVNIINNQITGFVFGTTFRKKLYKNVAINRSFSLIFHMLKLILKKPKKIGVLLKMIFCRPYKHKNNCESELVFIAINPLYQKLGIGRNLMNHFNMYLLQKGVSRYESSVEIENEAAQKFNEKLGFKLEYQYSEFGIKRLRYSVHL